MSGGSSGEIANYYVGIARWSSGTTRAPPAISRRPCGCAETPRTPPTRSRSATPSSTSPTASARCSSTRCSSTRTCLRRTTTTDCFFLPDGNVADAAEHFRTSADPAPYKEEPKGQLAKLGTAVRAAPGQETRVDRCQRGARRGARGRGARPAVRGLARARGQALREAQEAREAEEVYQKILVIDPGNANALPD